MRVQESILFSSAEIGVRQSPNRFVANPVERNMGSADGGVSDETLAVYKELARGEWGVVIVESTAATSRMDYRGPGLHALMLNNNTADSFIRLVDGFKTINPDSLLLIQLSPGGFGLKDDLASIPAADIARAKDDLVESILLARQLGFDGVDCKQCHGSFPLRLVSRSNNRKDEWGGTTVAERSRFVVQGVTQVRNELKSRGSDDFIIGTRVSENDVSSLHDMVKLFDSELFFDFINISADPLTDNACAVFALSQSVKLMTTPMPVIASAGTDAIYEARSFTRVTDLMTGALAPEFIGFGKQAIADPLLPVKLMSGKSSEIIWCNKCEGCSGLFNKGKAVTCIL